MTRLGRSFMLVAMMVLGLALFGGRVQAQGPDPDVINGDKTVFNENFVLRGNQTLNGTLVMLGGTATLERGATINGDLAVIGGETTIEQDATVHGNVGLMGGTLRMNGTIEGDIAGAGGQLFLGPEALVTGDIGTMGAVERDPRARVRGEANELGGNRPRISRESPGGLVANTIFWLVGLMMKTVLMSGLALAVGIYLPRNLRTTANTISKAPSTSVGVGCLSFLALGAAMIVCAITIIGLLLVPVLGLAAGIVVLFGWIALGTVVGNRLLRAADVRNPRPAAAAAIGTGALTLATGLLGVLPCVGAIISGVLTGLAAGAVVLSRFGTQPYPALATAGVDWDGPLIAPLDLDPTPPAPRRSSGPRPAPEAPRRFDDLFADMDADRVDSTPDEPGGPDKPDWPDDRPTPGPV
jgi:cytoskeletal protein CcmA (bactofilin family)